MEIFNTKIRFATKIIKNNRIVILKQLTSMECQLLSMQGGMVCLGWKSDTSLATQNKNDDLSDNNYVLLSFLSPSP